MFPAYLVKARNSSFNTRKLGTRVLIIETMSIFKLETQVLILETRYSIEHNTPAYL